MPTRNTNPNTPPTGKPWRRLTLAASLAIALQLPAMSQQTKAPLSDAESAPERFGWMQGAPPPPEKRLSTADGSFFRFPALRYSASHMREFLPTVEVSRGLDPVRKLPYALDPGVGEVEFVPRGQTKSMTWEESLPINYTDGIIVLHRGEVVYEAYRHALTETGQHAAMSCTKSYVGTLAAILAAEGKLDTAAQVTKYIPELRGSAYGTATVRQVMDMTTSLDYSEDYADKSAEIWQYAAATTANPSPDYKGPVGTLPYLQTLKAAGPHGEAFGYKTPNADVTAWLVTRAGGAPVDEQLSERIWKPLGMEQSAYFQVDALGTPSAGGGLNAGLRDMARFGELVRNMGVHDGRQVIPSAAIADIRKGGSKAAFAKTSHPGLEGWSYRNLWWITENANGAFAARGVHGQTIYIDPAAEMTIIRFASHPVAGNAANDDTSLPAYQAVADYLMGR